MSSTRLSSAAAASAFATAVVSHDTIPTSSRPRTGKAWVDPATLPHHDHESYIAGNTPDYVKQLNYNTFMNYGVGEEDCFGYKVGKAVRFTEVSVNRKLERQGRLEATTVAEIEVTKREYGFLDLFDRGH